MNKECQNVVDEAAIIFAGGDDEAAEKTLTGYLKLTHGKTDKRVWFMLLDLYQVLGKKEKYEKLSLMFADRFKASPPSWDEVNGLGDKKLHESASHSGRNVLIIEGVMPSALKDKIKDFMAASRETKTAKIDISRMKIENCSLEIIELLQKTMKLIRKYKINATLMGENHVVKWLEKKIEQCKLKKDLTDGPYWLFLLEILQWKGQEALFDEYSMQHTITYEKSGPGWEKDGIMNIETVSEIEDKQEDDLIQLDDVVTDMSIQKLNSEIKRNLMEKGLAKIEFQKVKRMDFSSAGTFSNVLMMLGTQSKNVILKNPSELIIALGDVVGFTPLITVENRKR